MLVALSGCRTSRVVEQTTATKTDSTTPVTLTPVKVHLAGETLKDTVHMTTFAQEFEKAQVGTVLRHVEPGKGKHLGYSITKISPNDWTVLPTMEPFDTTWVSHSTATRVHTTEKTTQIMEKRASAMGRMMGTMKDYLLWLLLLLVALICFRKTVDSFLFR